MKKLLLTLGSAAAVAAPLATVVACGDEEAKFDLATFVPEQDGIFLMDEYYGGTLYDEDGKEFTNGALPLGEFGYTAGENAVTQFGKDDSFVVVYDNDDEDGFSINNFEDTFGYSDSSTAWSTSLAAYNVAYGNVLASSQTVFTTFENGFSNRHIGSTYSWGDTASSLIAAKDALGDADYQALLTAYKFVEEADGSLSDDPSFDGSEGGADEWLRGGVVMPPQPGSSMFSYEKIGDNAMKVTYLFDDNGFDQSAGTFGFITETENAGVYSMEKQGLFSFGENSWAAYEASGTHIFQGKKA